MYWKQVSVILFWYRIQHRSYQSSFFFRLTCEDTKITAWRWCLTYKRLFSNAWPRFWFHFFKLSDNSRLFGRRLCVVTCAHTHMHIDANKCTKHTRTTHRHTHRDWIIHAVVTINNLFCRVTHILLATSPKRSFVFSLFEDLWVACLYPTFSFFSSPLGGALWYRRWWLHWRLGFCFSWCQRIESRRT